MSDKTYISAQQLLEDSFNLALHVLESGFRPHFIVGVWRGGTPVGIAVQEVLDWFGLKTDHIAIRTSSYTGINQQSSTVRVHGLGYLVTEMNHEDRLLIVDDVYDSGRSIDAIIAELEHRCRRNMPAALRVATAYYKPARNRTERVPDFYVHETDEWLVFPHELRGLSDEELRHKPGMSALVAKMLERRRTLGGAG